MNVATDQKEVEVYGYLPDFIVEPRPAAYLGGNYVVVDFETTNLSRGSALDDSNSIVLGCFRVGPDHPMADAYSDTSAEFVRTAGSGERSGNRSRVRVCRGGELSQEPLVRAIEQAEFLVAHNAKFELQWLDRCGLDLGDVVVYDTMLGDYVLGGNRWQTHKLSLEECCTRHGLPGKKSLVSRLIKAGVCPSAIPYVWLRDYCIQDVAATEALFLRQRKELAERGQLPVLYNRCLLTPVLADIEKNGMHLDADLVRTRAAELEQEFAQQQRVLEEITDGINLNSPKQLGEYLYDTLQFAEPKARKNGKWVPDRTPSGGRRTDAGTISKLSAKSKKQRAFLSEYERYKSIYNELTKYLRKFNDCVGQSGGILRASFNQTNTQTHRLSSTGADYSTQFQNFPRAYKPLFCARRAGWRVGETDGAQLEFRVAVHLGRDDVGLDDIRHDVDVHRATADVIGCSRQDAKAHTFKPLYGGQSGTDDQRRYYEYFRERYEGIAERQRGWIDGVLRDKSLTTEWGLRFYWPDTRMTRSGYITNTPSICNYPVQSLATAEIIPMALVCMWHRIRRSIELQMFIVNTIHDSIIAEYPEDEEEAFHALSRQCMIHDVNMLLEQLYGIELYAPLACGVTSGFHWGAKDEVKYKD